MIENVQCGAAKATDFQAKAETLELPILCSQSWASRSSSSDDIPLQPKSSCVAFPPFEDTLVHTAEYWNQL